VLSWHAIGRLHEAVSIAFSTQPHFIMNNQSTWQSLTRIYSSVFSPGAVANIESEQTNPVEMAKETESADRQAENAAGGTIYTPFDGSEDDDDDIVPAIRKCKRSFKSLSSEEDGSEYNSDSPQKDVVPVKRQSYTTPEKSKKGCPIGVWKLSAEKDPLRKHIIYAFIDVGGNLRQRIHPERPDGTSFVANMPTGTGSAFMSFDQILLDPALRVLRRPELREYVRFRTETFEKDESPQQKKDRTEDAINKAIIAVTEESQCLEEAATPEPVHQSYGGSPEKAPAGTSRSLNNKLKTKDVLLGYWADSDAPLAVNKHAIYGIVQSNNIFRPKVVPETRDGKPVVGNFPTGPGGCWVSYDTCVLQPYLHGLCRSEIEEYCKAYVSDPSYSPQEQTAEVHRAIQVAKTIVKALADKTGETVEEYNRRICDKRNGINQSRQNSKAAKYTTELIEPVEPPNKKIKTEPKHTAIRSDRMTSDLAAERLRKAKQFNKEQARHKATMSFRAQTEVEEATRRSLRDMEIQKGLERDRQREEERNKRRSLPNLNNGRQEIVTPLAPRPAPPPATAPRADFGYQSPYAASPIGFSPIVEQLAPSPLAAQAQIQAQAAIPTPAPAPAPALIPAPQATPQPAVQQSNDVKFINGVTYMRKNGGAFAGMLVGDKREFVTIDNQDYIIQQVMTKIVF
jgi:hypothetical protein